MLGRRIRAYSDPADLPRPRWRRWAGIAVVLPVIGLGWAALVLTRWDAVPWATDGASVTVRTVLTFALFVVLGLGTLYAIWRMRLERLARRPGPILVLPVIDRTATAHSRKTGLARQMTGAFQRHLAATRLYKSTAIPSSGTSREFLDVIEQAGDAFSVFWTPIMRLLRLLCPVSAYQVRCELLPPRTTSGDRQQVVVHVELLRLPSSSLAPALIVEDTWDDAIQQAAHRVAAAILPRTRSCRTPPWTPWQGVRLPRGLFHLVQRYQAELDDRRYDEAQATLLEARRADPGNLALRLELGKLQEKMDMHLDALLTYDDIISRASRTSRSLSRWWNRPSGDAEPWTDEGRGYGLRASHPVVHVARYRHALLLGLGDKLSAQWWDRALGCPVHRGARQQRRDFLRRILSERFTARYARIAEHLQDAHLVATPLSSYLDDRSTEERAVDGNSSQEVARKRMARLDARIFFTAVAVAELETLVQERRRWRPWRSAPRAQRRVLPRRSMEIALLSARMRRDMALVHAGREEQAAAVATPFPLLRTLRGRPVRPEPLGTPHWPWEVGEVHARVQRTLGSRRASLRSWHEHYNAACVHALLLLPTDPFTAAERPREELPPHAGEMAALAVDELTKAVACSDSGHLASQRTWLLNEDPDLDALRSFPEFRDFEAQTFGSVDRAHQRGPRMGIWQQTAHVADIICTSGHRMAQLWDRRAQEVVEDLPPTGELRGWIEEEREGWRLAELLAVDNRDWRTRHRIARVIADWAVGARIDLDRRPYPTYSEAMLARQLSSMAGETEVRPVNPDARADTSIAQSLLDAMKACDRRLEDLAGQLRSDGPVGGRPLCCERARPLVLAGEWARLDTRLAEGATVEADMVGRWCRASRDRWRALSVWFDDQALAVGSTGDRQEAFGRTMARLEVPPPQRPVDPEELRELLRSASVAPPGVERGAKA